MAMMTRDQAAVILENMAADRRAQAERFRFLGEESKQAANSADDAELRTHLFDESSRYFACARQPDMEAEAIEIIQGGVKQLKLALEALRSCVNNDGTMMLDAAVSQFELVDDPKQAVTILQAVDAALKAVR